MENVIFGTSEFTTLVYKVSKFPDNFSFSFITLLFFTHVVHLDKRPPSGDKLSSALTERNHHTTKHICISKAQRIGSMSYLKVSLGIFPQQFNFVNTISKKTTYYVWH